MHVQIYENNIYKERPIRQYGDLPSRWPSSYSLALWRLWGNDGRMVSWTCACLQSGFEIASRGLRRTGGQEIQARSIHSMWEWDRIVGKGSVWFHAHKNKQVPPCMCVVTAPSRESQRSSVSPHRLDHSLDLVNLGNRVWTASDHYRNRHDGTASRKTISFTHVSLPLLLLPSHPPRPHLPSAHFLLVLCEVWSDLIIGEQHFTSGLGSWLFTPLWCRMAWRTDWLIFISISTSLPTLQIHQRVSAVL